MLRHLIGMTLSALIALAWLPAGAVTLAVGAAAEKNPPTVSSFVQSVPARSLQVRAISSMHQTHMSFTDALGDANSRTRGPVFGTIMASLADKPQFHDPLSQSAENRNEARLAVHEAGAHTATLAVLSVPLPREMISFGRSEQDRIRELLMRQSTVVDPKGHRQSRHRDNPLAKYIALFVGYGSLLLLLPACNRRMRVPNTLTRYKKGPPSGDPLKVRVV